MALGGPTVIVAPGLVLVTVVLTVLPGVGVEGVRAGICEAVKFPAVDDRGVEPALVGVGALAALPAAGSVRPLDALDRAVAPAGAEVQPVSSTAASTMPPATLDPVDPYPIPRG